MIVKRLRKLGIKPQKILISFLSILLYSQTAAGCVGCHFMDDIKNLPAYKTIPKDIGLGIADSTVTIALLYQLTKSIKTYSPIKTLICAYATLIHLIPTTTVRHTPEVYHTFQPLVLDSLLIPSDILRRTSTRHNWCNISKIEQKVYLLLTSLYCEHPVNNPIYYTFGSLLAATFSIIKLDVNPIYTLFPLCMAFMQLKPIKKLMLSDDAKQKLYGDTQGV